MIRVTQISVVYMPVDDSKDFTITVLDLKATEGLLLQGSYLLNRAENLVKSYDYDGAIEAAQHSVELSIKSLYRLVGLPEPRTHFESPEALKRKSEEEMPLENVAEKLEGIPEHLMIWLAKTSWIGRMWAWAHNTSIYGCLDIPASKLFDENDAKIAIQYATTALINCRAIVESVKAGQTKIKPPNLAKKTK